MVFAVHETTEFIVHANDKATLFFKKSTENSGDWGGKNQFRNPPVRIETLSQHEASPRLVTKPQVTNPVAYLLVSISRHKN